MFTVASALRQDDFASTSTLFREYLDDLVKSVVGESAGTSSADARFGSDDEFDTMLDIFIEGVESSVKRKRRRRNPHSIAPIVRRSSRNKATAQSRFGCDSSCPQSLAPE